MVLGIIYLTLNGDGLETRWSFGKISKDILDETA